jgi:hypothetical protein
MNGKNLRAGFYLCWLLMGCWVVNSAASVGPAPIPPSIGVALDGEQGFCGHKINGVTPYLFNLKLGPVLHLRSYRFEPYAAVRYSGNRSCAGMGLGLSRFIFEPQNRGAGLRFVLDGSYYSGHQVLGQSGFMLDLDKLIRVGLTVGIGNKTNDHLFYMTSFGTDFAAIYRLLWPASKPY